MIQTVFYALLALVILSVIVMAHEFGHYIVGRISGIGIIEFSIGFGPKLWGTEKKGILYSIRAIPLGGYCKFEGEDVDDPSPTAFNNAPCWKRFLTVLAGPLMNFVLALIASILVLLCYGTYEVAPVIDQVAENTPAAEAGLEAGDTILSIDGEAISQDPDGVTSMQTIIASADCSTPFTFEINRNGEIMTLEITPAWSEEYSKPQIGIVFRNLHSSYSIAELIPTAFRYMANIFNTMIDSLRKLFFHGEGLEDTMGFVGIVSTVGSSVQEGFNDTASEGFAVIFYMILVISMNLGIMNLLPFPALDGGRLVFLIVEMIRRKPVPPEKEGFVHSIGMILLLILIVFITYKDIARLIFGT